MTDRMREEFEKWYVDPDCRISQRALRRSDENPDGYALMQAQSAWEAFKAAYNLREQEIQRLREALDRIINSEGEMLLTHPPQYKTTFIAKQALLQQDLTTTKGA